MNLKLVQRIALVIFVLALFLGGASDTESGQMWNTLGGAAMFTLIGICIYNYQQGRKVGNVSNLGK
ncbi:MAG: hypothetical protein LC798_19130 [Chloroflexi bacterium]|nr:hypothetical protein [Chloroflexota bacterium]